ncbi:porin [Paraburkholderia adhaesiva]|uniref:porin n=1 Tax=Paraburkholderia adhaesiva TaxID=2883244 RepID=UPI001F1BB944|nr:porin [Paraburkholderia adhaesiva]
MKKTTVAIGAALLALSAQSAFAQSSVTLYGIVDTAVRFQTNADPENNNLVSMLEGPITGSRWGLKGTEDLGGGLAAVFRLENGFNLFNGAMSSANTLFNRMAYVGLKSQYGTVTLGNQNSPFFDEMGDTFDPLTVANYWQDSWMYNGIGSHLRVQNSVKYANSFGGLNVKAIYGFGNQAGSVGSLSTYGFTASYAFGPLQALVGWQQSDIASQILGQNKEGRKQNQVNVGVVYTVVPTVRLLAGWMRTQDNSGTTDVNMQQLSTLTSSDLSTNRIDNFFYIGSTWQATAPLLITAAGYYGRATNAALGNATFGGGHNYSATLLAEYSLSKRTEVYGTVDYTRGTGAYTIDYPGRNNQTGVAVGLRNIF